MSVSCQVRSFAKEAASMQRYQGSQNKVLGEGLKSARASGFFNGINGLVGTGSIVLVLWFGARQVCPLLSFTALLSPLLEDTWPDLHWHKC